MIDRKILVTGSSSGIGRALTEVLIDSGATVIGLARDHSKFKFTHPNYLPYTVDLSIIKDLPKILKRILLENKNINGLVSNAGSGQFGGIENFSVKQIESFIRVNLVSHMVCTKMLLPHLKKAKTGNIIFLGSEAALTGTKKGSLYCAAKFGLRGFAQTVRAEASERNVCVSIVNPGMVRTPFFNKLGFKPGDGDENAIDPRDVAKVVYDILTMRAGTVIDEINLSPLKKVIHFGN